MNTISAENIIQAQIKSGQLADLLCMIVDLKGTANNSLDDDPVIVLAKSLALQVANTLFQEVEKITPQKAEKI